MGERPGQMNRRLKYSEPRKKSKKAFFAASCSTRSLPLPSELGGNFIALLACACLLSSGSEMCMGFHPTTSNPLVVKPSNERSHFGLHKPWPGWVCDSFTGISAGYTYIRLSKSYGT